VPVILKRLAAPRWVFILGIVVSLCRLRGRVVAVGLGAREPGARLMRVTLDRR